MIFCKMGTKRFHPIPQQGKRLGSMGHINNISPTKSDTLTFFQSDLLSQIIESQRHLTRFLDFLHSLSITTHFQRHWPHSLKNTGKPWSGHKRWGRRENLPDLDIFLSIGKVSFRSSDSSVGVTVRAGRSAVRL